MLKCQYSIEGELIMSSDKLQQRIAKQEQVLAKAQKALALSKKKLMEKERRERSRRLILVGVHAENLCESDPEFRAKLEKHIWENEQKPVNRKLFAFLPENQPQEPPANEETGNSSPKTPKQDSKDSKFGS
jgi:16S rRNA G1207 methylase RsmC